MPVRLLNDILEYLEKDTPFWDNLAIQLLVSRLREISDYSDSPQMRRMMVVVLRSMTEDLEDVLNIRMEKRLGDKKNIPLSTNCHACFNLRMREWSIGTERCSRHE